VIEAVRRADGSSEFLAVAPLPGAMGVSAPEAGEDAGAAAAAPAAAAPRVRVRALPLPYELPP
jgi:hypothetical protein